MSLRDFLPAIPCPQTAVEQMLLAALDYQRA
jgi:hypothetical protein